ncbi:MULTISPECIES: hypothetical protein [Aerosakkonema]|uniref:hypothetical protein n=1 Tax=Aerosakkonema TaxID=1246629 RepID=UPI0035B871E3
MQLLVCENRCSLHLGWDVSLARSSHTMMVQSQDCGIKAKVLPTAPLLINKKPGIRFKPGILAQALSKG